MLATSERVVLVEHAEKLAKMILKSDVAEQYRICLYKLKNNEESQRKINHFVSLKELYEEVQRFGKYHPDHKRVMIQIRESKREMDLDSCVAEFRVAENNLQSLLDEVSVQLGGAVSKHIKVPTGNPFFDTGSSCGGGCGSGGSCSCSA
ncbi:YlbF family regulator [Bacillus sp. EB600]|uniref:YlbF family regulator n=1 Tax=Bacillus sp. EB600 TaxID=2806345 RepID=UPI00210D2207|nr:YlbF family regulator [Bacillus sp. EB600]MCQ6279778.1 YlbF family regulator [Bacillus sp. EB600]